MNDVSLVFYRGRIRDGYFGATAEVGFALIGKKILVVADYGFYNPGLPDVQDVAEAVWILENRPYYEDGHPMVKCST